jgi:hypothetical protein
MEDDDTLAPATIDLPLRVRVALARTWVQALALEKAIADQPKDNLDEALWSICLQSNDLTGIGRDALSTLDSDMALSIVSESADAAMICGDCLIRIIWPDDEGDDGIG